MIQLRPHQERVIESMVTNPKGQVIVPTGGGKTLCMIKDAQRQFNACSWDVFNKRPERKTVVVVSHWKIWAPRFCFSLLVAAFCLPQEQSLSISYHYFHSLHLDFTVQS